MSNSEIVNLISSGGALGVMIVAFVLIIQGKFITQNSHKEIVAGKDQQIADKDQQIADYKVALQQERQRGDAGVLAANTARELVQGLRKAE